MPGSLSALQVRVLRALAGLDVKALVEAGADLGVALALVRRKDGGFSPPDLAWVLRSLNVDALARAEGYDVPGLLAFRDERVERLLG